MKDALTQKSDGFMPRSIALTLLTSKYSKTNGFRKRCLRAMEKVCEPKSRSTALPVSAPKTGQQRLDSRLSKATAKQLLTWHKRTLRRGNRYQDLLFEAQQKLLEARFAELAEQEQIVAVLEKQIAAHDALGTAIADELTKRSARGIGYRKPVPFRG